MRKGIRMAIVHTELVVDFVSKPRLAELFAELCDAIIEVSADLKQEEMEKIHKACERLLEAK